MDNSQLRSVFESVIFASDKPVKPVVLRSLFDDGIPMSRVSEVIELIDQECGTDERGLSLVQIDGGYQFRTKDRNQKYVKKLAKVKSFRLTKPALETLAIVAYKQPITKGEIDKIRGVESAHILRALLERKVIKFAGKSDLPGKPALYATTHEFLELFSLESLIELPTLSDLEELMPDSPMEVDDIEATVSEELQSLCQSEFDNSVDAESLDAELDRIQEEIKAVKMKKSNELTYEQVMALQEKEGEEELKADQESFTGPMLPDENKEEKKARKPRKKRRQDAFDIIEYEAAPEGTEENLLADNSAEGSEPIESADAAEVIAETEVPEAVEAAIEDVKALFREDDNSEEKVVGDFIFSPNGAGTDSIKTVEDVADIPEENVEAESQNDDSEDTDDLIFSDAFDSDIMAPTEDSVESEETVQDEEAKEE